MTKVDFVKLIWENLKTPLNATNLNRIETGIDDTAYLANLLSDRADELEVLQDTYELFIETHPEITSSTFDDNRKFTYNNYLKNVAHFYALDSQHTGDIIDLKQTKLNSSDASATYVPIYPASNSAYSYVYRLAITDGSLKKNIVPQDGTSGYALDSAGNIQDSAVIAFVDLKKYVDFIKEGYIHSKELLDNQTIQDKQTKFIVKFAERDDEGNIIKDTYSTKSAANSIDARVKTIEEDYLKDTARTNLQKQIDETKRDYLTKESAAQTYETIDNCNTIRQNIEAIESRSDVIDVVATKAALTSYNKSLVTERDIIRVLKDESQGNAITLYRLVNNSWTFVGSEGLHYTQSEANLKFETIANVNTERGRIKSLEDDHVTTAQKNDLQNQINANKTSVESRVKSIEDDYLTDATRADLQSKIDASNKDKVDNYINSTKFATHTNNITDAHDIDARLTALKRLIDINNTFSGSLLSQMGTGDTAITNVNYVSQEINKAIDNSLNYNISSIAVTKNEATGKYTITLNRVGKEALTATFDTPDEHILDVNTPPYMKSDGKTLVLTFVGGTTLDIDMSVLSNIYTGSTSSNAIVTIDANNKISVDFNTEFKTFYNTAKLDEATRVSNESVRISNETSRKSAETSRVNAEKARVTAESNRVTEYTELMNDLHAVDIDSLNNYAARLASVEANSEVTSNKVTSINSASTDTQYPTAKLLWSLLPKVIR